MSALTFTLREQPPVRIDASALIPSRLSGLTETEINALPLTEGQAALTVGDVFAISMGKADNIRFDGDCARLDYLGAGLDGGQIRIAGAAGAYSASGLVSGEVFIEGDCGPFAATAMKGGTVRIAGNAGAHLGGAMPGEMRGMQGGLIHVKGNSGDRTGHRMRRGTIFVEGDSGAYAGSNMIAGTLVVLGLCGLQPGSLMRRGSLVLSNPPAAMLPSFLDAGEQDFVWLRVLSRSLTAQGACAAAVMADKARRFAGDMAALGKGEILVLAS